MRLFKKPDWNKIRGELLFGKNSNVLIEKNCIVENKNTIVMGGNNHIARYSELHSTKSGGITLGKNSQINRHCFLFDAFGSIKIGKGTIIGDYCLIYGSGGLIIGDNVIFAPYVSVITSQHNFEDVTKPIKEQGNTYKGVTIGDGSWIGIHATILDGVNIGKNCVIAAGSIVKSDVPDYSVAAGVPAKIIKQYDFALKEWVKV